MVTHNGTLRRGVAMPLIPGHEVSGLVDAVGPGVRGFRPGDRVASAQRRHICGSCRFCRGGRATSCREQEFLGDAGLNGGYAEFVHVEDDNLALVPDEVALDEAAIVARAIGTELNAIRDVARVRPGEFVLVTGAGGGRRPTRPSAPSSVPRMQTAPPCGSRCGPLVTVVLPIIGVIEIGRGIACVLVRVVIV